jgi:hypothetical protein
MLMAPQPSFARLKLSYEAMGSPEAPLLFYRSERGNIEHRTSNNGGAFGVRRSMFTVRCFDHVSAIQKIFFDLCKKHRLSQRAKSPVFIERNPAFFTKIHEKNKSCQSHGALEIEGARLVGSGHESCIRNDAGCWILEKSCSFCHPVKINPDELLGDRHSSRREQQKDCAGFRQHPASVLAEKAGISAHSSLFQDNFFPSWKKSLVAG